MWLVPWAASEVSTSGAAGEVGRVGFVVGFEATALVVGVDLGHQGLGARSVAAPGWSGVGSAMGESLLRSVDATVAIEMGNATQVS